MYIAMIYNSTVRCHPEENGLPFESGSTEGSSLGDFLVTVFTLIIMDLHLVFLLNCILTVIFIKNNMNLTELN